MLRLPQMPETQFDTVALAGGYDQLTSAYALPPGSLRDCINFACLPVGGYYRIPGYERHDGRPKPSSAQFVTVDVDLDENQYLNVGDSGTFGNISGTVCYLDPGGVYVGLTKTVTTFSSTFVPGPIVIGGNTIGQATAIHSALNLKTMAIIKAAAANIYRADIQQVPGSGPIRGVIFFRDAAYAFRDNIAATGGDIYKATSAGWQLVNLGYTLPFNLAGPLPKTGEVLTQGAVTATVQRTLVREGDPTANTAAGYMVISNLAGGDFIAGDATFSSGFTIKITAEQVAIFRRPGGRVTFSVGNFFAQANTEYLYCADGENDAFEFDGSTYTPLPVVGVPNNAKPKYAQVHSNHLFLAIGSSLIHSALGDPYNFEVINGAGEIGTGGNITGMLVQVGDQSGGALMVFARNSMWVLYGTSAHDWKFVNYNVGVGAWDYTSQNLFDAFALDDRGITAMKQTLNYGNFDSATLTHNIQPFIGVNRGLATCSGLSRQNSQYRVFFSNGYGIYTTVNPQGLVGSGVVLFPDIPVCMSDAESSTGQSVQLFGTADGWVMWNDLGTSFDGKAIGAFLNTNINVVKTPRMRKRFRRAVLELYAQNYVEMDVTYSFEWASPLILPHNFESGAINFMALPYWDAMLWDSFFWDGRANDALSIELNGTGENMQMMIFVDSDYVEQFAMKSVIFHYTPRRGNR